MRKKIVRELLQLPSYYRVYPCCGKKPLGKNWQQQQYNYSPEELAAIIVREEKSELTLTGYGLICGQYSRGYLISIDCDHQQAIEKIRQLNVPPSVSFTSGRDNRKQILYYLERPIPSFKNQEVKLEIRGTGHFCVLPPSIHPKTNKEYYWLLSPKDIVIPRIDSQLILELALKQDKAKYDDNNWQYPNDSIERAKQLISKIDPQWADDYWSWISVGMALHNISVSLLEEWKFWSSHSNKFKPGECEYKWKSFHSTQKGYSLGTLYYFAKKNS